MQLRRDGKSAGLAERLALAALAFFTDRLTLAEATSTARPADGRPRSAGRESPIRQPAMVVEQFQRARPALLPGVQDGLWFQRPIVEFDGAALFAVAPYRRRRRRAAESPGKAPTPVDPSDDQSPGKFSFVFRSGSSHASICSPARIRRSASLRKRRGRFARRRKYCSTARRHGKSNGRQGSSLRPTCSGRTRNAVCDKTPFYYVLRL